MNWLRWRSGRQNSGYYKMLLFSFWRFDCYLLKFTEGSSIKSHVDPVPGYKHYRLNILLKNAEDGGDFVCDSPLILNTKRVKFFRSDLVLHSVTKIVKGSRYVLSFGFCTNEN